VGGVTISVVRSSNPVGLAEASEAMQRTISALDDLIESRQRTLDQLSLVWSGAASDTAIRRGRRLLREKNNFRDRLHAIQTTLFRGGSQLSALREEILSTTSQATTLGGIVGDDGSVQPTSVAHMLTPTIATAYSTVLRKLLHTFEAVDEATASGLRGGRPGTGESIYQAVDFVVGGGAPEAPPDQDPAAVTRRQNEINAFKQVFGRHPESSTDWKTAAALDPHSYDDKYNDEPPSVVVGRIEPVPGQGIVKSGLFIPRDVVFNVPRDDLGDNRGFDPNFGPEETRVSIYVDYENGLVIARQNPSVDTAGNVRVLTPDIKVQQAPGGAVRIQYEAANGFAPPGAELSGHVVRGDIVVTPGAGSAAASVDGVIGDYPSLEVYQDLPTGQTYTLAQDAADSGNVYGPLTELPFSHEIGEGTAAFAPFESLTPQLPGGPRYPGDAMPYVPGRVDPNTPTELAPADKIPNVVVVR
jgi:hypothetical protein